MKHTIVLCSHIVDDFLTQLPYELVYTPTFLEEDKFPAMRDVYDYPIIVTAILEDVDVLISGDKDFAVVDIDHPEIINADRIFV